MKIGSVALDFPSDHEVSNVDIASSRSFLDFDVLILNLEGIRTKLQAVRLDVSWRKTEIVQMLRLGRNILVLMCPFQMSALFHIGATINFIQGSGQRIDFRGPENLKAFWDSVKDLSTYRTKWKDGSLGEPILYVDGVDDIVGSWFKCDAGNIFFLPAWDLTRRSSYQQVVGGILRLSASLNADAAEAQLPKWSLDFGWEHLDTLSNNLARCRNKLTEFTRLESESAKLHKAENDLKLLIAGTGESLERKALEVFREIGFTANKGTKGRDDIILEWNGGLQSLR